MKFLNVIDGADKLITDANNRLVTDTDISNWNNKSDKGHKHTKNEITDFPTSLPANGGNADTVDNKHASDFATKEEFDNLEIGGRNLIIRATETPNTWIAISGDVSTADNHSTSDYISVVPNENLAFSKSDSELASDAGFFRWA